MLLAVRHRLAALGHKARSPRAQFMQATPAKDVHHTVSSMLLAVDRHLAALDIKDRMLCTRVM